MADTAVAAPRLSAPGRPRPVTPSTILAARLEDLARRMAEVDGVPPALLAELGDLGVLAGGLDPYLARCTTPESQALAELARRTAEEDWNGPTGNGVVEQEMLSGHVEGQFLKLLVHLARATDVLEIGMFTGYSALAMAEALPADGRVVALELDAGAAAFARESFAVSPAGDRIDVRVGPAQETLAGLADAGEQFDLVFLDADKAGYRGYLDTLIARSLTAPHALICVDNTLMQGEPWTGGESSANGAAIHAFNRAVAEDPRVEQVIVPLRDGLTLIRLT